MHFRVTFSEPLSYIGATSSEFEEEPVQGRKVSKVIKTMVVQGERMKNKLETLHSHRISHQPKTTLKRSRYWFLFNVVTFKHFMDAIQILY